MNEQNKSTNNEDGDISVNKRQVGVESDLEGDGKFEAGFDLSDVSTRSRIEIAPYKGQPCIFELPLTQRRYAEPGRPRQPKPSDEVAIHREFLAAKTTGQIRFFAERHGLLLKNTGEWPGDLEGWFVGKEVIPQMREEVSYDIVPGPYGVAKQDGPPLCWVEPLAYWHHHQRKMAFIRDLLTAERESQEDAVLIRIARAYETEKDAGNDFSELGEWVRGLKVATQRGFRLPYIPTSRHDLVTLAIDLANEELVGNIDVHVAQQPLRLVRQCRSVLTLMYANVLHEALGILKPLVCCKYCKRWFESQHRAAQFCDRSCNSQFSREKRRAETETENG